MSDAAAFAAVALVLVISPGPDSLLILRNALAARRAGLLTMGGVQIGVIVHAALAGAGLSALLYASPALFRGLAALGAAYLLFLGISAFRAPLAAVAAGKNAGLACLRDGMLCNLLNPKVVVLFVALMPNFIDPSADARPLQFARLALILLLINIPFQTLLVILAQPLRRALASPRFARGVQAASGGFLVFFALMLLAEHAR